MISIAFALCAAASYGTADFLGGVATRRSSVFAAVVPAQAAGLVLLAVLLPVFGGTPSQGAVAYGVLGGICGGAGIALLYHALSVGKMGVVSPITAVLAAAVPLAAGVLHGERLSPLHAAGVGVALAAVVLISLNAQAEGRVEFSRAGVKEAVASGLLLGGFYLFLAAAPHGARAYPLVFARLCSTGLLASLAFLSRRAMMPTRATAGTVAVAGILDAAANGLYVAAAFTGYVSIAAVLTSLYPAATVLLARFTLHERLQPWQTGGVALALAGVAMIAR
ncbi:MAG: EamA family transporter [Candidatus Baltobacteraceae bacterium]